MKRPIGFSTGALAKGDFARGLQMQRREGITAIELSALRDHDLKALVLAARGLDLEQFEHVSVHAPSKYVTLSEAEVFSLLSALPAWPIVVHPDVLHTPALWRSFGSRLCIENMDSRKTLGQTVEELRELFKCYPKATFCLDLGHARQIDPTMAAALLMLHEFDTRLIQLHVSNVNHDGAHLPVTCLARWAYEGVSKRVPRHVTLIIESVVNVDQMEHEMSTVSRIFDA